MRTPKQRTPHTKAAHAAGHGSACMPIGARPAGGRAFASICAACGRRGTSNITQSARGQAQEGGGVCLGCAPAGGRWRRGPLLRRGGHTHIGVAPSFCRRPLSVLQSVDSFRSDMHALYGPMSTSCHACSFIHYMPLELPCQQGTDLHWCRCARATGSPVALRRLRARAEYWTAPPVRTTWTAVRWQRSLAACPAPCSLSAGLARRRMPLRRVPSSATLRAQCAPYIVQMQMSSASCQREENHHLF